MKYKSIVYNLFAFGMLFVFTSLLNDLVAAAGTVGLAIVATPGGQFTTGMQHYRELLSSKVSKEAWVRTILGKLTALIDTEKYKQTGRYGVLKNSPAGPQSGVVNVLRDFVGKKGVSMDVPLKRPLTGVGKFGGERLKGSGEQRAILNQKVAINMRRHAVLGQDNEMSMQILAKELEKEMASMESGAEDLRDWFSRALGFENWLSVFYGWSHNIFHPLHGLGTSFPKKSHPNTFVQGYNTLEFEYFNSSSGAHVARTFDSGWEIILATALASLTDTSDDHFKAKSIRNMAFFADKHKIPRVLIDGMYVHLILIHSAQAKQLSEDSEWRDAMKYGNARKVDNPIITGAVQGYVYENCYIVVDDTIPSAYITGDSEFVAALSTNGLSTGVQYGTTSDSLLDYMENPRDPGNRKGAVLLGQGAINVGACKSFKLTKEVDDHEQWIEYGGRMIYGGARADIIDSDNYLGNGAGLFYGNHSSLIWYTYSPDNVTI